MQCCKPDTNSQGVHGAAAHPDDGMASLLSRPQYYWAFMGSDRQSSEATHKSEQYPSGSEALPAGWLECNSFWINVAVTKRCLVAMVSNSVVCPDCSHSGMATTGSVGHVIGFLVSSSQITNGVLTHTKC